MEFLDSDSGILIAVSYRLNASSFFDHTRLTSSSNTIAVAHLESSRTSKLELFAKIAFSR